MPHVIYILYAVRGCMNDQGGSIRTQVSLPAEDFAAIREWGLRPSDVLHDAIDRIRMERTPQVMLAALDAEQASLDERRRRLDARMRSAEAVKREEIALDEHIGKLVREYPQSALPNAILLRTIWGYVLENALDYSHIVTRYRSSEAIKKRLVSGWESQWLAARKVSPSPQQSL